MWADALVKLAEPLLGDCSCGGAGDGVAPNFSLPGWGLGRRCRLGRLHRAGGSLAHGSGSQEEAGMKGGKCTGTSLVEQEGQNQTVQDADSRVFKSQLAFWGHLGEGVAKRFPNGPGKGCMEWSGGLPQPTYGLRAPVPYLPVPLAVVMAWAEAWWWNCEHRSLGRGSCLRAVSTRRLEVLHATTDDTNNRFNNR